MPHGLPLFTLLIGPQLLAPQMLAGACQQVGGVVFTADDARVAREGRSAEFRASWHEEHGTAAKPRS